LDDDSIVDRRNLKIVMAHQMGDQKVNALSITLVNLEEATPNGCTVLPFQTPPSKPTS
jgi:hypothetical protein